MLVLKIVWNPQKYAKLALANQKNDYNKLHKKLPSAIYKLLKKEGVV